MDDYLKSISNEKDLIGLTWKVVSVLKCHGFNLEKFSSNSETVLQSLPQSTLSQKCELRIFFANIRTSFRNNLEYSERHIYFRTDHKVFPQYKTLNPQSDVINIRPTRHTYTAPPSTLRYSSTVMETKYRLGWANSKHFIKTVGVLEGGYAIYISYEYSTMVRYWKTNWQ